jgi:uncharacterized protein YaeQ
MAQGSQIYHVDIQLADTDNGKYADLQFSTPQHPSETAERLVLRLLAFALLYQEGLNFRKGGVSQGEDPDLSVRDLTGQLQHWIEIGTPAEERLQKAARHTPRVTVFTHDGLLRRWKSQHGGQLPVFDGGILCLQADLVENLQQELPRRIQWQLTISGGMLYLDTGHGHFSSTVIHCQDNRFPGADDV